MKFDFFQDKRPPELKTVILTFPLNNLAAGTRNFTFFRVIPLYNIWVTTSNTTLGIMTFTFRTFDTSNQPYVQSAGGAYLINQVNFNSYQAGLNNICFHAPLMVDYIDCNYPIIAAGTFLNIHYEVGR
jgi:hypothetical protein